MSSTTTVTSGRFGPVLPPEFVPSPLVRVVFQDTEPGTALQIEAENGTMTLLPWSSSKGRVAAYAPGEDVEAVPVELDAKELRQLLQAHDPVSVPLAETPAQALLGTPGPRDVAISWHARVRWNERVREETYPAGRIHTLLEDAVELSRHRGWYNPEWGVRVPVQGPGPIFEDRLDVDWIAKTVIPMDEDDIGF